MNHDEQIHSLGSKYLVTDILDTLGLTGEKYGRNWFSKSFGHIFVKLIIHTILQHIFTNFHTWNTPLLSTYLSNSQATQEGTICGGENNWTADTQVSSLTRWSVTESRKNISHLHLRPAAQLTQRQKHPTSSTTRWWRWRQSWTAWRRWKSSSWTWAAGAAPPPCWTNCRRKVQSFFTPTLQVSFLCHTFIKQLDNIIFTKYTQFHLTSC